VSSHSIKNYIQHKVVIKFDEPIIRSLRDDLPQVSIDHLAITWYWEDDSVWVSQYPRAYYRKFKKNGSLYEDGTSEILWGDKLETFKVMIDTTKPLYVPENVR
jgi:hypothetical protein